MKPFFDTKMILDFMKENNLTRAKFCKLCNIGTSTLCKVLKNDTSLRADVVFKLANGMNVEIKELLYKG